ncbi:MAG: MFS transporter [Gemmatimonadaceae bacterium]|nr:MFS transporter [Chitinophagaceae bacterium]
MDRKQRMILLVLALINFTHILDFMIMMPLGNYLMPFFKISAKQFTFLVSAYTISAAASGFGAAFFVDRFDRKKVLLLGYVGFVIGTIACGISPNFWLLLASRTLAGLFGGLIGAQVLSIISDIYPYEQRGKAMGAVMSSFAVASTLGVPFALYLSNLISWHAPFLLVGFLGVLVIPMIIYLIPPMSQHLSPDGVKSRPIDALRQVTTNNHLMLALLFSMLIMMGHFLIIPFVNPYLEFNMGFSKFQTPMIYLVGGAASFVAANVLGRLADRYGKLLVFTICLAFSFAIVFIITHLPVIPFAVVLTLFGIWFALSTGRGLTAQAMISNTVPPAQRGSFMSFNSSVQQLGTGIASMLAGFIVVKDDAGKISHYGWLGFMSIGILFVALMLARYLFAAMEKKVYLPVEP